MLLITFCVLRYSCSKVHIKHLFLHCWYIHVFAEMHAFQKYMHVRNKCMSEIYACQKCMYVQKQPSRCVLRKRCSEICSKFTGEYPFRSVVSIKLLCSFIEITLRHGCSPASLLHIFRTPFPKNTSGRLLLHVKSICMYFQKYMATKSSLQVFVFFGSSNISNKKFLFRNLFLRAKNLRKRFRYEYQIKC